MGYMCLFVEHWDGSKPACSAAGIFHHWRPALLHWGNWSLLLQYLWVAEFGVDFISDTTLYTPFRLYSRTFVDTDSVEELTICSLQNLGLTISDTTLCTPFRLYSRTFVDTWFSGRTHHMLTYTHHMVTPVEDDLAQTTSITSASWQYVTDDLLTQKQ